MSANAVAAMVRVKAMESMETKKTNSFFVVVTKSLFDEKRRWHEYEEDEQLPDLSKIFKNRQILDSKAEDIEGSWHIVTRKNKKN